MAESFNINGNKWMISFPVRLSGGPGGKSASRHIQARSRGAHHCLGDHPGTGRTACTCVEGADIGRSSSCELSVGLRVAGCRGSRGRQDFQDIFCGGKASVAEPAARMGGKVAPATPQGRAFTRSSGGFRRIRRGEARLFSFRGSYAVE